MRTEKGKKMVMMLMMRRSHEYLVLADEFVLLLLLLFPSSTSLSPIFCEVWTTSFVVVLRENASERVMGKPYFECEQCV